MKTQSPFSPLPHKFTMPDYVAQLHQSIYESSNATDVSSILSAYKVYLYNSSLMTLYSHLGYDIVNDTFKEKITKEKALDALHLFDLNVITLLEC